MRGFKSCRAYVSRDFTGEKARKLQRASKAARAESAKAREEDLRVFFGFRDDKRIWDKDWFSDSDRAGPASS